MSDVIHYFNPAPLLGVLIENLGGDAKPAFPDPPPPPAEQYELREVEMRPSGELVLTVYPDGGAGEAQRWPGVDGVGEGADGGVLLQLPGGRGLLFPAKERERVTSLFMKWANAQY